MDKKILHISTSSKGGAGNAAVRLHLALLSRGVNSTFLCLSGVFNAENKIMLFEGNSNQITEPEQPSLGFKNLLIEKISKQYNKKKLNYAKERELLEDKTKVEFSDEFEIFSSPFSLYDITSSKYYQEADIIHFHWTAGFLDFPSFFSKNTKPLVWTIHDENLFRGGFHYENDEVRNQKAYGEKDNRYKHIKKEIIAKQKDLQIISPSEWLADKANQSNLFSDKVNAIYNLIDFTVFKPLDSIFCKNFWQLKPDVEVFLFVANDTRIKRKGLDLLLPLVNDNEFKNCQFLIVGENSTLINQQNVFFTGKIFDERMMALAYNAADYFLLPSLEDNLPNTLLESLACGVPVISFDISDLKDIIEHNQLGIVAKETSSKGLKAAMIQAINGGGLSNKQVVSTAAHNIFNNDNIIEQHLAVYAKFI